LLYTILAIATGVRCVAMERGEDPRAPSPRSGMDQQQISASSLASPSLHLVEHITRGRFSQIMADFNHRKQRGNTDSSYQGTTLPQMTTEDFQEAMSRLLGRPREDPKIILLCKKVRAVPDVLR
jgi:hypothetical protein